MNSTALQIYSFFMRTNLQFVRYCHPAYTNRNQWKSLLKKSKLEATMPVCSVIPHESGYALYLHPEETPAPSGSESLTAACCTLLHCLPHTLSPLGLLFDTQNQCPLYVHPDFQSVLALFGCFQRFSVASCLFGTVSATDSSSHLLEIRIRFMMNS